MTESPNVNFNLDNILNQQGIDKYIAEYFAGDFLCLEGKDSRDLFILLEGNLEVFKGPQKLAEISKAGALVGEISFLLQRKRTATVKAKSSVRTIRIPQEKVHSFLETVPALAWHISQSLAQRLKDRSQALFALQQFSNHLQDAVIATDLDGSIIIWNKAAEELFGKKWEDMQGQPIQSVYAESKEYQNVIKELKAGYPSREQTLKVHHPEKGLCYVSVSTSALYDHHSNLAGLFTINRDITESEIVKLRYRRIRRWLLPSLAGACLLVTALFAIYPRIWTQNRIMTIKQQTLRDQIAKDIFLIKSIALDSFAQKNTNYLNAFMAEFFSFRRSTQIPYKGVICLDTDKEVFCAHFINNKTMNRFVIGSSYAAIPLNIDDPKTHKVLTLYWADQQHPSGRKHIELAFRINMEDNFLGWLLLQMDTVILEKDYDVDINALRKFNF